MTCLFCKIVQKEIPATIIYENEHVLSFDDINPQAPHHKIIIPKTHIATINDLSEDHRLLMGEMLLSAAKIAKQLGIHEEGYRLVSNCNQFGGQTVFHWHLHLLGGRPLFWPPG